MPVIILLNTTTAGEWWVQKRDLKEDIGFHHDKDEVYVYMYMYYIYNVYIN